MSTTSMNNTTRSGVCGNGNIPDSTILNHLNHCVGKYLTNYSVHKTSALHLIKIKLYTRFYYNGIHFVCI